MSMIPMGGKRGSIRPNAFDIPGSFQTNGANPPLLVRGKNFTVARTGAGTYTVTLKQRIPNTDSVQASAQCVTEGLFAVEVGPVDLTAKTIILRTLVAGVATDIAADTNNRVNFSIAVGGN